MNARATRSGLLGVLLLVAPACRGECRSNEECIEQTVTYRCVALTPPGGNVTLEPKAKSEP
jgi:hypothetical protein